MLWKAPSDGRDLSCDVTLSTGWPGWTLVRTLCYVAQQIHSVKHTAPHSVLTVMCTGPCNPCSPLCHTACMLGAQTWQTQLNAKQFKMSHGVLPWLYVCIIIIITTSSHTASTSSLTTTLWSLQKPTKGLAGDSTVSEFDQQRIHDSNFQCKPHKQSLLIVAILTTACDHAVPQVSPFNRLHCIPADQLR